MGSDGQQNRTLTISLVPNDDTQVTPGLFPCDMRYSKHGYRTTVSDRRAGPRVRLWAGATGLGAAIVTSADAVLLERSKGFFRGGFLSVDYLEGPGQVLLFVVASLVVDATVIGLVIALVGSLLRATRLHIQARVAAGLLLAVGGLLAFDAASYRILQFLGGAFDLQLVLDLVDGQLSEILAVSSSQLLAPLLVAVTGCAAVAAVVVILHRHAIRSSRPGGREPALAPVLLAIVGSATLGVAATSSDVLENGLLRKPTGQLLAATLNQITDIDRDGYGVVGRSSDPDPFNAGVYPYAVDIPGNGVDEDGVGGDLPAAQAPITDQVIPAAPWTGRPDVVLFVLESFRADVVGARFDGRSVTPVLDALGARGLSSAAAYSHNGYTVQSRFHLFTGTLAGAPGAQSLIDDFKSHGYRVGYFSGQDESFGGSQYAIGYARADVATDARSDRGKRYSTSTTPGSLAVPMGVVTAHVRTFLESLPRDVPMFLCVNFHDTHFPYTHDGIEALTTAGRLSREDIVPAQREGLRATYLNTAANVDREIGRVLDAVRTARGRDPGVIVTSDHGESLFDEGFLGHGYGLNDAQTRVPMIIADLPARLPEPMAQSDLRGVLLDALGSVAPQERPVRVARGEASLFQYLGNLSRPREIAFVRSNGRILYDFRTGRGRVGSGAWTSLPAMAERDHEQVMELIRYWERIQLTRRHAWQRGDD